MEGICKKINFFTDDVAFHCLVRSIIHHAQVGRARDTYDLNLRIQN